MNGHGAHYLGPENAGVRMNADPNNPLPFASPGPGKFREEQNAEFDLLGRLNRLSGIEYPDDPALRALLELLGDDPLHPDQLAEATGARASEIAVRLCALELGGWVATLPGGRITRAGGR